MAYPLDITLRVLELVADTKGITIENIPEYVDLCEYLTCIDMNCYAQSPIDHKDVFDTYSRVLTQVIPECTIKPMDFHRRCQKI